MERRSVAATGACHMLTIKNLPCDFTANDVRVICSRLDIIDIQTYQCRRTESGPVISITAKVWFLSPAKGLQEVERLNNLLFENARLKVSAAIYHDEPADADHSIQFANAGSRVVEFIIDRLQNQRVPVQSRAVTPRVDANMDTSTSRL